MNPLRGTTGTFLLFVYGSLRKGGLRHGPLAQEKYLREAVTLPKYNLIELGEYPGLIHADQGIAISGELYEVHTKTLEYLDAVEGAPSLFRLDVVEIAGETGPVWAYYYVEDASGKPRIDSGKWQLPR